MVDPLDNITMMNEDEIPVAPIEDEPADEKLVKLPSKNAKKSDEAGSMAKFWNWATQLF